jgi:hypothetical protein
MGVDWGGALPASFIEYGTPDVLAAAPAPKDRMPVFDPY